MFQEDEEYSYDTFHSHTYKIIVVGEIGTGKTSLIRRIIHNNFSENIQPTIGINFVQKIINWSSNTKIELQLWDIAGNTSKSWLTRMYYTSATAALILFDINNMDSFKKIKNWKRDIDEKVVTSNNQHIPCLLIGNKSDISDWGKSQEEMKKFCKNNGFLNFFKVSTKEDNNVKESINFLLKYIIENDVQPEKIESIDILNSKRSHKSCC